MRKYAVVYRDSDTNKIIRESGYTFEAARKRASKVRGDVHMMIGAASRKVK